MHWHLSGYLVVAVSCCVVLACAIYIGLAAWGAYKDVAGAPRKRMYICDAHGPMSEESCIQLFDDLEQQLPDGEIIRAPLYHCPICFESKIKQAGKQWQ